jgi:hypothetical protein
VSEVPAAGQLAGAAHRVRCRAALAAAAENSLRLARNVLQPDFSQQKRGLCLRCLLRNFGTSQRLEYRKN